MKRTRPYQEGKALLLEVGVGEALGLTPDGRFLRLKRPPGAGVGAEIELGATTPRTGWRWRPKLALAAGLALCLVVLSPFAVAQVLASGPPVAFVSVDVNPSLEFGVNRWDRVVSARGLNAEGEILLTGLTWSGRRLADVAEAVAEAAAAGGYLEGELAEIVLSMAPAAQGVTVPPGIQGRFLMVTDRLRALLRARGPAGGTGELSDMTVATMVADTAAIREQAEGLGLSVGRYLVLLAAQEAGLDVEPADFEGGIGRAIIEAGGRPDEVIRAAHLNRAVSELAERFRERNGLPPDGSGQAGPGAAGQAAGGGQGGPPPGAGQSGGQDKNPWEGEGGQGQGSGQGQSGGQGGDYGTGPGAGQGDGPAAGQPGESGDPGDGQGQDSDGSTDEGRPDRGRRLGRGQD